MTESMGNIRFYCEEHAPAPKKEFAEKSPEFFIGKYVKKQFTVSDADLKVIRGALGPGITAPSGEHMWVKISSVDGDKLVGTLDNDPIFAVHLLLGNTVRVSRDEIEEVIEPPTDKKS